MHYVPLHTLTGYSFLSSALKIDDIINYSKNNSIRFAAVSDFCTLSSFPELAHQCINQQITPIYGMTLSIQSKVGDFYIALYVKNEIGYKTLCNLLFNIDKVNTNNINQYSEGLILVLPTVSNVIIRNLIINNDINSLEKIIFALQKDFKDFYIGLECYSNEDKQILTTAREFAINHGYQRIAFPKNLYFKRQDAISLEILNCIKNDQKMSITELNGPFYFLSEKAASLLYTEEEITATESLCNLINFRLIQKRGKLLNYPVQNTNKKEYIQNECENFLKTMNKYTPKYKERLIYELNIIDKMGYLDYFLIVRDYVQFAKKNSIPVGPGRGSACGSLVSYALNITEIDPLEYGLIFERFLNPERVSMPDIDIDIADIYREKVIDYIRNKYSYKMADIITFQTIGAKQALRDIGRIYSCNIKDINTLCSFFPDSKSSLTEIESSSLELKNLLKDNYLSSIFNIAKKIEGLPRQSSVHPAGIIINDEDLYSQLPLNNVNGKIICQYESIYLEEQGFLKMDILGLKTLTIIDKMINKIKETNTNFNINEISYNDNNVFSTLNKGLTLGLFQIESIGMTNAIKQVRIDSFENIADMLALYRPGPIDQISLFAKRKNMSLSATYVHPSLKDILDKTYGIIIYQEQIMEICQKCALFSFAQADLFRRAISKKNMEMLSFMKNKFIDGCQKNKIDSQFASKIYDLIFKFANYGFNKSHAVAYSKILYVMAYLKTYHPQIFYCVLLDYEILNDKTIYKYKKEMDLFNLKICTPDINISSSVFTYQNDLLYVPFSKIKGIQNNITLSILQERKNGNFTDFASFISRMKKYEISITTYVTLINAGCLDSFNETRSTLLKALPTYIQYMDFFGDNNGNILDQSQLNKMQINFEKIDDDEDEKIDNQYKVLGFRIGPSKLTKYKDLFLKNKIQQISTIFESNQQNIKIGGIVLDSKIIQTKKDKSRMATFTLYDDTDQIRCVMFSDTFLKYGYLLEENNIIIADGYVKKDYNNQISYIISAIAKVGG